MQCGLILVNQTLPPFNSVTGIFSIEEIFVKLCSIVLGFVLVPAFLFGCAGNTPDSCKGVNGLGVGVDKGKAVNDGEFVKYAYQAALQREADPTGLTFHCEVLRDGRVSRADLIEAFSSNAEHNNLKAKQ